MQVVASLLAFAMLVRKQDQVFAFVIVWALFAISSKQGGSVSECAFVLAVIVLLATLASFAFPKQLRAMGKRLEGRTSSVAI